MAQRPRAGYLGPQGTFSEEALLTSAAPDAVEPFPLASIYETIGAVGSGEVQWALVPIENSLEGSIRVTLDMLADERSGVSIAGEALLRVRHSLIGPEQVELAEIDTVITHPQVPGQCTRFLRGELARARILPASSTAEAVRIVAAEGRREQAALGTALAAHIYGARILREDVQDSDENETRFVWITRSEGASEPPLREREAAEWKTSLVFWGSGSERPGWLVRCLDVFARRSINLTKIESRPRRKGLGSYMFFADLSGRTGEAVVDEAIGQLHELCEHVRVLGAYRAAAAPGTPTDAAS
jgi:prephenate dehydratase